MFAAAAVAEMGASPGLYVLLEGREQTVNFVRTPHRFSLVLSDETLIGKRRAAQRLMGVAAAEPLTSDDQVGPALDAALAKLVQDIAP